MSLKKVKLCDEILVQFTDQTRIIVIKPCYHFEVFGLRGTVTYSLEYGVRWITQEFLQEINVCIRVKYDRLHTSLGCNH